MRTILLDNCGPLGNQFRGSAGFLGRCVTALQNANLDRRVNGIGFTQIWA